MNITVVAIRHAKPDYPPGSLSEEGRAIQNAMSIRLKNGGIEPDIIFHSPLLRAAQTAAILADHLHSSTSTEPALGEEFDPDTLINGIKTAAKDSTIIFVGHEPTLAQFVEQLTGKHFLPRGLQKSEAVVIQFENEIGYGKAKLINRYEPE